jgi:hypothetical protein
MLLTGQGWPTGSLDVHTVCSIYHVMVLLHARLLETVRLGISIQVGCSWLRGAFSVPPQYYG